LISPGQRCICKFIISPCAIIFSFKLALRWSSNNWAPVGPPAVALARRHSNELDRLRPSEQALFFERQVNSAGNPVKERESQLAA